MAVVTPASASMRHSSGSKERTARSRSSDSATPPPRVEHRRSAGEPAAPAHRHDRDVVRVAPGDDRGDLLRVGGRDQRGGDAAHADVADDHAALHVRRADDAPRARRSAVLHAF